MIQKTRFHPFVKTALAALMIILLVPSLEALQPDKPQPATDNKKSKKTLYGLASFYANKFHGRRTANGEIFNHSKLTAACNVLPLGTWIRITNLKNGKIVIVRTNDRLHPKTRRLVDLTKTAAQQLGFISRGLTRVKIEVLDPKQFR